ncbi:S24 family peptidase [Pseudomonas sp. zfem002]|uniref:S24 family peptidase n=1 Tax=Pseudomonas sp. zfem002 TaxID=3078197 RepID=UPI00292930F6|nr:S24 family peptidase [Pseudomonas sp. zfem002]MDU9394563.1 S24 family peptidase [Pseudomonas sp. zfem002]
MDIYEIRKHNLIKLIGNQRKGSCAERWGMAPAHLSQILSDKTAKNLGDDVSRRIEEVEQLPRGWFDSIPSDEEARATSPDPDAGGKTAADLVKQMLAKSGKNIPELTRQRLLEAAEVSTHLEPVNSHVHQIIRAEGEISIPQYDIRAAMGHGQVPSEYSEVIRNVVIREELLREKGVTYTSAQALGVITGWGQSMEGTINDKDPVIVDRGVNDYEGEGVYVLTWHGDLLIKRVQRQDENHVWLISDNRNYEKQSARIDDITIHAKVLLVWNARKI